MTRVLILQALLSGTLFGIYPLLLNYSGVGGNLRTGVYCLIVLVGVAPFAISTGIAPLASANWWVLIGAGLVGATAQLTMNTFITNAPIQHVGTLFAFLSVTQVIVGALYHVTLGGGQISLDKVAGFILACVAIHLLLR